MGFHKTICHGRLFSFNEIKDISGSSTADLIRRFLRILDNQIKRLLLLTGKPLVRSIIATFKKTLVGYENGLLIVIDEAGKILT
jgi:hypothetical protein